MNVAGYYLGTGPVDDTGRLVGGIRFPSGNMSLQNNIDDTIFKYVAKNYKYPGGHSIQ